MKRRPKVELYAVPRWMAPALQVLRPKKRLPVSAWAEANRILPDTNAVAGPWRNALTPYLMEIMDAFSDDATEQIVLVKATQVGGTSAMENALGSAIDQDPGPAMMVYPFGPAGQADGGVQAGAHVQELPGAGGQVPGPRERGPGPAV